MTIIRGFNFSNYETVTADKLYSLVASAQFTNVDWNSYMAPGLSIVGASEPASPGVGALWTQYEQIVGLETSSYSGQFVDFNVFIQSPQGKVGLFSQNRMESRLAMNVDGNNQRIGKAVFCQNMPHQSGVTLDCRPDWGIGGAPFRNGQLGLYGTTWGFSCSTGPSISGFPRVSMLGLSALDLNPENPRTTYPYPAFVNLAAQGGASSKLTQSCCSVAFMAEGLGLGNHNNGVSFGWLFGGPVFRTG
jgi:hypothetical protein